MNAKLINVNSAEDFLKPETDTDTNFIIELFKSTGVSEEEAGQMVAAFGSLFALSDEKFKVITPFFLEKFEEELNDSDTILSLAQALNIAGMKAEDLREYFKMVIEGATEDLKAHGFSDIKIDFLKRIFDTYANSIEKTNAMGHRVITIPIQKLSNEVQLPSYARVGDAGMDVYALENYTIKCGETKIIPTGIKIAIPKGYAVLVQPRSGISAKSKLRVANTPGLIDSGYRDEIGVIIENIEPRIKDITTKEVFEGDKIVGHQITSIVYGSDCFISKGQKIAQLRLVETPLISWDEVSDISVYDGDRGGGFGSTDVSTNGENKSE